MKIVLVKRAGSLHPVDDDGHMVFNRIKEGQQVMADVKRARNPRQHRLFFAFLRKVADNQDFYDVEGLHNAIKVALGYCDTLVLQNGQVAFIPKSASYAAMPQDDFEAFFDRAVNLVIERWLPGVEREDLRREVLAMVS